MLLSHKCPEGVNSYNKCRVVHIPNQRTSPRVTGGGVSNF